MRLKDAYYNTDCHVELLNICLCAYKGYMLGTETSFDKNMSNATKGNYN